MARTVRNPKLDTRSARAKLTPRREPYWCAIGPGRHLGYRQLGARGGTWIAKLRIPGLDRWTRSLEAAADNVLDANGGTVLTFAQAQEKARTWFVEQEQAAEEGQGEAVGPYFVADAVGDYLDDLRARRGSPAASDAGGRLKKHLLPRLGDRRLADLIEADFRGWRNSMVIDGDDEDAVRRSATAPIRCYGPARPRSILHSAAAR